MTTDLYEMTDAQLLAYARGLSLAQLRASDDATIDLLAQAARGWLLRLPVLNKRRADAQRALATTIRAEFRARAL